MIPVSERSLGKGIGYPPTPVFLGFSGGSAGKESTWNVVVKISEMMDVKASYNLKERVYSDEKK